MPLQSCIKHLWTFSRLSTVSFHHKWNETRLLSPESECMSCITSCQTTKIRKFQENPWNTWTWWRVPVWLSNKQILSILRKDCEKSAVKHSIEKHISLNFWICLQSFVKDCGKKISYGDTQECTNICFTSSSWHSYWVSRNSAVPVFFWYQPKTCFLKNFW